MEELKVNIVQTAMQLFRQLGIRNVSIDNVCNELRISKKTFYTCFGSKEDLVEAVILMETETQMHRFQKAVKDKNAIETFIFTIKEIKRVHENEPFLFWHDLQKYYPALYRKYDAIKTEIMRKGFEENIRQGIREGFYRENLDVELLSFFHSIQMKNTFEIMMQSSEKFSSKRLMDFFIDLIIHLIANEKGLKFVEDHLEGRS